MQLPGHIGRFADVELLQLLKQPIQMRRRRSGRKLHFYRFIHCNQSRQILLRGEQIRQTRRDMPRIIDLTGKFPGSILPGALAPPIAQADGAHDLYVQQDKFRPVFAADVPEKQARLMAATQRPVTDEALKETSGAPAWKSIPSWFVYGSADSVIPPAAHAFMAQRAGSKDTIVVRGASHVVMVSHPSVVADLIEKAAQRP